MNHHQFSKNALISLVALACAAVSSPSRAADVIDGWEKPAPVKTPVSAHKTVVDAWDNEEGRKQEPRQIAATPAAAPPVVPLLKGQVTYCVPQGTPIKLKLSTVPGYGLKMMEKDLDGNYHPAKLGDEITAKTTEDIYIDDNKVIPLGTVFHGKVSGIVPPKRAGIPGSVELSFDSFKTPDGRTFAFRAEANNKQKSTSKSKLKRTGWVLAHTAGGAIVGALVAYEIFGLKQTIAMHGYNIAGGAGAGAIMATAVALLQHGHAGYLEPGENLNMSIDTDLLIPAATSPTDKIPTANLPGLDIKVLKTKVKKDGLDGYLLKVKMVIANNTHKRLQSIDLFLEDDNGARYSIEADPEEEKTDMLFTIEPLTTQEVNCDFLVEYPKMRHKIVWLEHGNSRGVIYEARLPDSAK